MTEDPASADRQRRFHLVPRGLRARLTVLYTSLFLVGGAVLLAITFVLVSHSFSQGAISPQVHPSPALLAQCKAEATHHPPSKSAGGPKASGIAAQCQKAFTEGLLQGQAAQRDHTLHELEVWSLAGLAVLAVASAALGWLMAGRVMRPVREITGAARRASEQHLGERINLSGPEDELKELADTFDDMLDRLDQAFAAQRLFVANASHELRTPLTSMRTAIDVVLAKPEPSVEQLEATAVKVRRSIERAEHIVDALLTLAVSNQGIGDVEALDLATAAEDALDAVADQAHAADLGIESELAPAEVHGNRILLERLVANLVENAVGHNTRGGWVRVRTGRTEGGAVLEVANGGPMVPDDLLPLLFEPFQRGAGRIGSSGVGLGLSIVRAVAETHGARLEAVPGAEGGLTVTVTVPGEADATGAPAPGSPEAEAEAGTTQAAELEAVSGSGPGAAGRGDGGPAA